MAGRSLVTASLAACFFSFASGVAISSPNLGSELVPRNDYTAQPPCSYPFTPFTYVGCYVDPSLPGRALDWSPGLPSNNMTVELCTASCKSNGFRYAGLEYYGECFCGDSVLGPPAQSESNCSYACTGNNAEICGGFDFVSIYMDTTFANVSPSTTSDYVSVGCYSEGSNGRAIAFQQNLPTSTMTTEICLQQCKLENYPLAATEYAGQCFCGVVIGNGSMPADSSNCNMACNGNSTEMCGGSNYLNLYMAQDLEEAAPCGPTTASTTMTSTTTSTTTSPTAPPTTTTSTTSTTTTTSTTPTSTSTTTSTTPTTTSTSSTTSTTPTTTSTTSTTTTTTTTISTTPTTTTTTSTTPTATSTTTTTASTKSTSTTSTTSTTPTMTTMTTTTKTTSTTTSSKCITTAPAPTCEYGCGSWCSKPLPYFNDQGSCFSAYAYGKLQVADCFAKAGWSNFQSCFQYASWCEGIGSYAQNWQSSKGSKSDCYSKNPPKNGPSTTPGICTPSATTTTAAASTSSTVCPPTATGVCTLPDGGWNSGYSNGNCVGNIHPPIVTCNNVKGDFSNNPWKCYSSQDTDSCKSYPKNKVSEACQDACQFQYNSCMSVYAQSCKGQQQSNSQDSYSSASQKCQNQYSDCLDANDEVSPGGNRCGNWNQGWS